MISDEPEIEIENEKVHSGIGKEAKISCIVHGEPKPTVSCLIRIFYISISSKPIDLFLGPLVQRERRVDQQLKDPDGGGRVESPAFADNSRSSVPARLWKLFLRCWKLAWKLKVSLIVKKAIDSFFLISKETQPLLVGSDPWIFVSFMKY